jgi:hypothetical protein
MGPEQLKVAYKPAGTFTERLWPALEAFFDEYNIWPNACYVSLRFPGEVPEPLFLGEGEPVQFRRQTLLSEDEILLGVEIETTLGEGDDGQFDERAIG